MKVAYIVAPKRFEIREIDIPTITDNEILVKIEACGVCSSDMPGYLDSINEEQKKRMPFPRRAGHEPSGTVVEVGKNVKGFEVGDKITGFFGDGCYAQYVSCDPSDSTARGHGFIIEKIPDDLQRKIV